MLKVENLSVKVGTKQVLTDVSFEIKDGETFVLFGPNGSGKTSLLMTIMGFANYKVQSGKIWYRGEEITNVSVDERAKRGIGILFQRPPTIRGVTLRQMVTIASHGTIDAGKEADALSLGSFLDRDVNHGFSGGEIKRSELLQLAAQDAELILLDEPESGVDLENICLMGKTINRLLQKDVHHKNRTKSGLIITHTGYILDYVEADRGCVLIDGKFICRGNPRELFKDIQMTGYRECALCQK